MPDLIARMRRVRAPVSIAFDATCWLSSYLLFAWLRFEGATAQVPWTEVGAVALGTALLYLAVARAARLHQGRAKVGTLEEMLLLGSVTGTAGGAVFVVNLFTQWIPRSVPVGATMLTLVLAAWARAAWRRLGELDAQAPANSDATRVLVVGAGEAGRDLIGSMLRDRQRQWQPVGLLDDDPQKRHRRVRGIPVAGTTDQLAEKAAELGVRTVVVALPSASSKLIHRLRLAAVEAGLSVKVLPATTQLLRDRVGIHDLRDVNLTDVLGRNQLDTDVAAIAGYLTGRRVLVTGAGGSIGTELARQIHRYRPSELMLLDRDESGLHAAELAIHGRALLDSDEVILCDIRDRAAVTAIFAARRPEVVFHAAALKHLPMLEQYPAEAVKTNIIGTRNVLNASHQVGVGRFVNVSTDKAANPTSVLGYSKRIAERVTAQKALTADGVYLSVRFGNVLGSRGSVLTSFASQIAEGGPVTVTDPEVTRYFMTIEEACQLVIQAAAIGSPGEVLVLDIGKPIRIVDVARQLIEQSGTPVRIEFTGLRPGEKLHEALFGDDEASEHRTHPLVAHVPVPTVSAEQVESLPQSGDAARIRQKLRDLCGAPGAAASRSSRTAATYFER